MGRRLQIELDWEYFVVAVDVGLGQAHEPSQSHSTRNRQVRLVLLNNTVNSYTHQNGGINASELSELW